MKCCSFSRVAVVRVCWLVLAASLWLVHTGCGGDRPDAARQAQAEQELQQLREANQELQKLRAENQELPRLRRENEELQRLRTQIQELDRLRQENEQLRGQLQALKPVRPAPPVR